MIKQSLRFFFLMGLSVIGGTSMAGEKLSLKDITAGQFRSKSMTEVRPMPDGETYARSVKTGDAS